MIQAIFWDNDGVLVDTEELFFEANRKILAEQGIDLSLDDFAELSLRQGRSVLDLVKGMDEASREALRQERNRYYEVTLLAGFAFEEHCGCENSIRAFANLRAVSSNNSLGGLVDTARI